MALRWDQDAGTVEASITAGVGGRITLRFPRGLREAQVKEGEATLAASALGEGYREVELSAGQAVTVSARLTFAG